MQILDPSGLVFSIRQVWDEGVLVPTYQQFTFSMPEDGINEFRCIDVRSAIILPNKRWLLVLSPYRGID